MGSPLLNRLSDRVQQAASTITALKKERERLLAEINLIQEESRRSRRLIREHQELLAERGRLKLKLERLLEKLDKLKV